MRRFQIFSYLIVVAGVASTAIYGSGYFMQKAYAYQLSNNLPTKLEAGSFWLTMNPEPFLYPGIALSIIGVAMAVYSTKKSLDDHFQKQSAEAAQ